MAGPLAGLLALAGCTSSSSPVAEAPSPQSVAGTAGTATQAAADSPAKQVHVRFTSGESTVDVRIAADNPTAKDFLTLLPMTLPVEEFAGREKIAQLHRELESAGSPGSDPENGDLIYFTPWGNVGFYYNTDGIGYSDQTIHLGTYTATPEQLAQLEGANVTVEVVP